MEKIIGYELIKKIPGYKTEIGRISKKSEFFHLYKDNENFKPIYEIEPNFEIGKWYKYYNSIGKYNGTINGLFTVSEYIYNNTFYDISLNNNSWGFPDNEKILLTDLTEIQQYLPDGHVDKINVVIPDYLECITGHSDYIISGYIYKVINSKNLHSLVLNCNIQTNVYKPYTNLYVGIKEFSFKVSNKEAFENQVKKKYKYEVVHCKTQEEWDFVNSKLENKFKSTSSIWKGYVNQSCKCLTNNEYSSLDFYKNKNSLILTFQEWCDKFGHVNPFIVKPKSLVGRYLKALVNNPQSTNLKKDDFIKILDQSISENKYLLEKNWIYTTNNGTEHDWELMPEEFNPLTEKIINNNDLLEEAKRRYPIGTIIKYNNREYEVTKELKWGDYGISHSKLPFIYHKDTNKWAEIVSTPKSNITNRLSNIRINHSFNEPIKPNNVLLLDTVIQPIKIETISDKLNITKQIKILTLK